jgi:hypothetical protein
MFRLRSTARDGELRGNLCREKRFGSISRARHDWSAGLAVRPVHTNLVHAESALAVLGHVAVGMLSQECVVVSNSAYPWASCCAIAFRSTRNWATGVDFCPSVSALYGARRSQPVAHPQEGRTHARPARAHGPHRLASPRAAARWPRHGTSDQPDHLKKLGSAA